MAKREDFNREEPKLSAFPPLSEISETFYKKNIENTSFGAQIYFSAPFLRTADS